jgi:hypothetical protein
MAGPLKNARHERYCQLIVKGSPMDAAYADAGYAPSRKNAQRLRTKEAVGARINELQARAAEKVAEKVAIDAAWVLEKAADLHDKALAAGAFSAAKGALDLIGKHVDVQAFREQINHSGLIEYKNLSDEEITARIAAHEVARGHSPTAH